MFETLKKEIYLNKLHISITKGINEGKIVPFDEEFYNKMNDVFINCIPVSIHIKYLKPIIQPGRCYDRSLYMFFCFDDALLVRGDNKELELRFGKEHAGHGWIEIGDYVYDPTTLMRYEKDYYYQLYKLNNVQKISKEEYNEINDNYYDEVRSVSIFDFSPNGSKRMDLLVSVPLIKEISEMSGNKQFQNEVASYLEKIEYDSQQIYEESEKEIFKLIKKKTSQLK